MIGGSSRSFQGGLVARIENIGLGGTWNPRGELNRLIDHLPLLAAIYAGITLVVPPDTSPVILGDLNAVRGVDKVVIAEDWSWGRHLALEHSLALKADYVQYADMDRLLRWIETCPEEWKSKVFEVLDNDCIIFGRTEGAYRTHPRAISQTEAISNQVFSSLLKQPLDLSAGSKSFSRRAVEYLVAHSTPGRALGMDAQWPILLYEAGFSINMVWVDGLDWESADRYQQYAADTAAQIKAAESYDRDPENWAYRVEVALEIVEAGLEVIGGRGK